MNKIIKILGPSGAGKTSVVRRLMVAADRFEWEGQRTKPDSYKMVFPDFNVYALGSYESNCGGVDTVDSADKVMKLADHYAESGHVVYEGLLQSTYYGKMGEWSQGYGDRFIYAYLNTPLEVCMDRLHERRAKNGTKRPLNEQQARDKWETVMRAYDKAAMKGHDCRILHWDAPTTPQLLGMLND